MHVSFEYCYSEDVGRPLAFLTSLEETMQRKPSKPGLFHLVPIGDSFLLRPVHAERRGKGTHHKSWQGTHHGKRPLTKKPAPPEAHAGCRLTGTLYDIEKNETSFLYDCDHPDSTGRTSYVEIRPGNGTR
jgi:hypothetical protein